MKSFGGGKRIGLRCAGRSASDKVSTVMQNMWHLRCVEGQVVAYHSRVDVAHGSKNKVTLVRLQVRGKLQEAHIVNQNVHPGKI